MTKLSPPDPTEQPPTLPPDWPDDASGFPAPDDVDGGNGGTAALGPTTLGPTTPDSTLGTVPSGAGAAPSTPDASVTPAVPLSGPSASDPAPVAAATDQDLQQQLDLLLSLGFAGKGPDNYVEAPDDDAGTSENRGAPQFSELYPTPALPSAPAANPQAPPPPEPPAGQQEPFTGELEWLNPFAGQPSSDDWANPYPAWPGPASSSEDQNGTPVPAGPQAPPPTTIGVSGGIPDAGYTPPPPEAPEAGLPNWQPGSPLTGDPLASWPATFTPSAPPGPAGPSASAVGMQPGQSHPPHFLILSGGLSWVIGITGSVTLTNDENLYFGIGPSVGTPGGGASLTGGWMLGDDEKSPRKVNSFVHGFSFGVNAMLPVPLGPAMGFENGDPYEGDWLDPNNWAVEPGAAVGSPGFQVQMTYSFGPIHLGSSTAGDPVSDPPSGPPAYDSPFPWL
jgi:hypothetical protein